MADPNLLLPMHRGPNFALHYDHNNMVQLSVVHRHCHYDDHDDCQLVWHHGSYVALVNEDVPNAISIAADQHVPKNATLVPQVYQNVVAVRRIAMLTR